MRFFVALVVAAFLTLVTVLVLEWVFAVYAVVCRGGCLITGSIQ